MKIGILGAKIIGATLGRKWAAAGHDIMFGVRNTENPETIALAGTLGAAIGLPADAIAFGDCVLCAIPGDAMDTMIRGNAMSFSGKTVIDAANRMSGGPMNSASIFASASPDALVYRAFNSVGWEVLEDPRFGRTEADLFYCGPDGQGRAHVEELIRGAGMRPIRVGDISQVHLVDMIGGLWFALAYGQQMGRQLSFRVMTR